MTEPSKELKVLLKKIKPRRRWSTSKSSRQQHRVMNFGLQRHVISTMLGRKGISDDLIDLHALIDRRLTLSENIALISEAVGTSLRVEHHPTEKEILKEQSDTWTQYMRENHLTHYIACKRDGKTRSDEVGEPKHGFLLREYIKNTNFLGCNMKTTQLKELPKCDIPECDTIAAYDEKTVMGPWGYLCEAHHHKFGTGIGTRLEVIKKRERQTEFKEIPTVTVPLSLESVVTVYCPACGQPRSVEPDANYTVICESCDQKYRVASFI